MNHYVIYNPLWLLQPLQHIPEFADVLGRTQRISNCNYATRNLSLAHIFLYLLCYQYSPAIHSWFSHLIFSNPLKACTLDEYEAAESLLSLFSIPLKGLRLPFEDHNMDVDPAPSLTLPFHPFFPLDMTVLVPLTCRLETIMDIDSEFLDQG